MGGCYWFLHTGAPADISFSGYRNRGDYACTIPGRTAPYWIMFGHPFEHRTYCSDIKFSNPSYPTPLGWAAAYDAGLVESSAQGFDAARPGFFTAGPADFMVERTVLEPWYGYWLMVKTSQDLTITIPVTPAAP